MKLALIVAMAKNRGIGKNNDLLWHLPTEMKFFRETTLGHVVVMGRKNYESIPEKFRPLQHRENAVLSRNSNFEAPGCSVFKSLESCIEHYRNTDKTVFVIGGGQIYEEVLQKFDLDEMYITVVQTVLEADTYFPEINETKWCKKELKHHEKDDKNPYSFTIFHYSK